MILFAILAQHIDKICTIPVQFCTIVAQYFYMHWYKLARDSTRLLEIAQDWTRLLEISFDFKRLLKIIQDWLTNYLTSYLWLAEWLTHWVTDWLVVLLTNGSTDL